MTNEPVLLAVCNNNSKILFLTKVLKKDYVLLFAKTTELALEVLENTLIDCVLIDEKISPSPPFSLCQKIRNLSSCQLIPIMLLTSSLKKTHIQAALKAGFSDFINEPLEKEELLLRLAVAFSRINVQKKMSRMLPEYIAKAGKTVKKSKVNLALRMRKLIKGEFFTALTNAHDLSSPLCLLLIELDDYTNLKKDIGEAATHQLVQELGNFLHLHLRTKDLLFPQGDSCFLAILPTTSASAGHFLADMIREEVSEHVFSIGGIKYPATISVGLVHYDKTDVPSPPVSAFEHLIAGAMRALQLARKKGNQTVSSSPKESINYEISI